MSDGDPTPTIPGLTAEIVSAYVSHHSIATADIGRLVSVVAGELGGLGREPEPLDSARPEPAVPVRQSVKRDRLVCLVCGMPFKSLRRHLQSAHGLTPAAYRQMFELAPDYPMVAAASTEQRAAIARRTGLGQRRPVEPETAVEPEVPVEPETVVAAAIAPQSALKPARGRRPAKKTENRSATDPALQPQPEAEPKPRRRTRAKAEPTSS